MVETGHNIFLQAIELPFFTIPGREYRWKYPLGEFVRNDRHFSRRRARQNRTQGTENR